MPCVSQTLFAGRVPSSEAVVAAVGKMSAECESARVCLVAHSYGTVCAAWIVRNRPQVEMKDAI